MILTESEAKEKWCSFARVGNEAGCNRYPMENDAYKASAFAKCIGAACMSWRFAPQEYDEVAVSPDVDPEHKRPGGEGWSLEIIHQGNGLASYKAWQRPKPPRGYCGLAGKP